MARVLACCLTASSTYPIPFRLENIVLLFKNHLNQFFNYLNASVGGQWVGSGSHHLGQCWHRSCHHLATLGQNGCRKIANKYSKKPIAIKYHDSKTALSPCQFMVAAHVCFGGWNHTSDVYSRYHASCLHKEIHPHTTSTPAFESHICYWLSSIRPSDFNF